MPERLKALIIEDDATELPLLNLIPNGPKEMFNFLFANTLSSGLKTIKKATPDIILLDPYLPDIEPINALRMVIGSSGNIPLLIVSSMSDNTVQKEAQTANVDYFLKSLHVSDIIKGVLRRGLKQDVDQMMERFQEIDNYLINVGVSYAQMSHGIISATGNL